MYKDIKALGKKEERAILLYILIKEERVLIDRDKGIGGRNLRVDIKIYF